jgi:hypothetical protein
MQEQTGILLQRKKDLYYHKIGTLTDCSEQTVCSNQLMKAYLDSDMPNEAMQIWD